MSPRPGKHVYEPYEQWNDSHNSSSDSSPDNSRVNSRRPSETKIIDVEFFDRDNIILVQFCPGLDVSLCRYGIPAELRHLITSYYQKPMHSHDVFRKIAKDWCNWDLNYGCERIFPKRHMVKLTYGHISGWDTSRITDMSNVFMFCGVFNENLNDWDVSNVTTMKEMFYDAGEFNCPLNKWNVSNVTNMEGMFKGAARFNQCIDMWSVGKVTTMRDMFNGDFSFNQPLNNWDVSQVRDMAAMFHGRNGHQFNQTLDKWNVSNVTNMAAMFYNCEFNHPLNTWNVGQVTTVCNMFYYSSFNQPLDQWDVRNIRHYSHFLCGSREFAHQYTLLNWEVSESLEREEMRHMLADTKDFDNALYQQFYRLWPAFC